VADLIFGTEYEFVIQAATGVGYGNVSVPLITSTQPDLPGQPGVPQLVGVAASHNIMISYDAPESDGRAPILNYKVYILDPSVGSFDQGTLVDHTGQANMIGLNRGQLYNFKVSAINRVGEGPASKLSKSIKTKDEEECNVTMRFYPVEDAHRFPFGVGTPEDFNHIYLLDVARSIGVPLSRLEMSQVTNTGYMSFWLRSEGGENAMTVQESMDKLTMQVVDDLSMLHNGVLTWQTDTHFLTCNGKSEDLLAARQRLGGPGNRLQASMAAAIGTGLFLLIPMFWCGRVLYTDAQALTDKQNEYKVKYVEKMMADAG